jgi:uncharacterized membrane protein YphA (DoxX/SURF4 family)
MDTLLKSGRFFFAISLIAFGAQYLIYGRFVGGLPPVPEWTPGGRVGACLVGAALVAAGICIATNWKARISAALVGIFFVLCVIFLHTIRFSEIVRSGVGRTRAFEPLAIGAAALVLAGITDAGTFAPRQHKTILLGRWIFAISMVIFGIQHFMYLTFIATLIPAWIPGHLFWVYLTGTGFIAAGVTIITGVLARLGSTSLGIMFLLWVLLLHAPRVAAALHNGDEWSSLWVALCLSGSAFVTAQSFPRPSVEKKNGLT